MLNESPQSTPHSEFECQNVVTGTSPLSRSPVAVSEGESLSNDISLYNKKDRHSKDLKGSQDLDLKPRLESHHLRAVSPYCQVRKWPGVAEAPSPKVVSGSGNSMDI